MNGIKGSARKIMAQDASRRGIQEYSVRSMYLHIDIVV